MKDFGLMKILPYKIEGFTQYVLLQRNINFDPEKFYKKLTFSVPAFWEDRHDYYVVLIRENTPEEEGLDFLKNFFDKGMTALQTKEDVYFSSKQTLDIWGFLGTRDKADTAESYLRDLQPKPEFFLHMFRSPRLDLRIPAISPNSTDWQVKLKDVTSVNYKQARTLSTFQRSINYITKIFKTKLSLRGTPFGRISMVNDQDELERQLGCTVSILVWCSKCRTRVNYWYDSKGKGSQLHCVECNGWCS